MTFVGKILVILIMAFSLVFLGVSTVVFTTSEKWNDKYNAQKKLADGANAKKNDAEARAKDAQANLDKAVAEHKTLVTEKENRIKDLEKKITDAEAQETEARSKLEVAQTNAQQALGEATSRKAETETLASTLDKAQTQANQFNNQNLELTDRIRVLEREKNTAEQNEKDLREFKAKAIAYLQQKGIDANGINQADPNAAVPNVEGQVKQVNATNRSVEITIGSNDGLAAGQELVLYRLQPSPKYLGQVKIVAVYPNKAVADVVGQTVNRLKIQEGDIVANSFNR